MDHLTINTTSAFQPPFVPSEEQKLFDTVYAIFQERASRDPRLAVQVPTPLDKVKLNKIYSTFPEFVRPFYQCGEVANASRIFDIQNKLVLSLNESFMPIFSKIAYGTLQTLNPKILEYLQKRYVPNVNDEEILKIYFLLEDLNFITEEILETTIGEKFIRIYLDQRNKLNALSTLNPAICTILIAVEEVDIHNEANAPLFKAYFHDHLSLNAQEVLWKLLRYHLKNQKSVFDLIDNVSKIACFLENFVALNLDCSIADEACREILSASLIGNLPNMNEFLSDFASLNLDSSPPTAESRLKFDRVTLAKILREISSILTPGLQEKSIAKIVSSFKFMQRLVSNQSLIIKPYTNALATIQSDHPQEEAIAIIQNFAFLLEKFQSSYMFWAVFAPPVNKLKVLVEFAEHMLVLDALPAAAEKIVDFLSKFFNFGSDLDKRKTAIEIYVRQLSFEKVFYLLEQTTHRATLNFVIKAADHPDQNFVGNLLKELEFHDLSKFTCFPTSFWKELKKNKLYEEITEGAIESFFSEMPELQLSAKVFDDLKQVIQLVQRKKTNPLFQQIITDIPPDIRARYLDFFIQKCQEPELKSFSHDKRLACLRLLHSIPEKMHEKIIKWISTVVEGTVLDLRHDDYVKKYPFDMPDPAYAQQINWISAVNRNMEKRFYSTYSTNYNTGVGTEDFRKSVDLRNHLKHCANEIAALQTPLNPLNPYLVHKRIKFALNTEELCSSNSISHITLIEGGYKYSWNLEKIRQIALQHKYSVSVFYQMVKGVELEEYKNYQAQMIIQNRIQASFYDRSFIQEVCELLDPLDSKSEKSFILFLKNRFHKQVGYEYPDDPPFDPYTHWLPKEVLKLDPKQFVIAFFENLGKHMPSSFYVNPAHLTPAKQLFGLIAARDKKRIEDYLFENKDLTYLTRLGCAELLAEVGYFNKEKQAM